MLLLTKWNTIKADNNDKDKFTEITVEDFLNTFEKNKDKYEFELKYDEEQGLFNLKYERSPFVLNIGEELKENYKKGLFNDFTYRLKKISDKQIEMESEYNKRVETQNMENKILKDAENGIIEDEKAKQIYLAHLKEENKPKLRNISNYFKNLGKDILESFSETSTFVDGKLPFGGFPLFLFHLIWTVILAIGGGLSAIPIGIDGNHTPLIITTSLLVIPQAVSIVHTLYQQVKNRVQRLEKYIGEKNFKKEKRKRIENLVFDTNLGQTFKKEDEIDKKIETNEKTLNNPKLIKKIDELVLLLKGVDPQKRLLYKEILRGLFSGHSAPAKIEEIDTELYLSKIKEYINQNFKGQAISNTNPDFSTLLDQEQNSLETSQVSTQSNMGQAYAQMEQPAGKVKTRRT